MPEIAVQGPHHPFYNAAAYRIRVLGWLHQEQLHSLAALKVSLEQNERAETVSVLVGQLPDQAALMGVLDELYGAGFPLLSVEHLGGAVEPKPACL